jgi:hypothetical protein
VRLHGRASKNNGNFGEDTIRKVLTALREVKTLNNIAGWQGNKYVGGMIVDRRRLKQFCNRNPLLGKRIRALAEKTGS